MTSSPTVTLFTEQLDRSRRPASLVASLLIHVGVIALVSFGILYSPRVEDHAADPLMVRHIDLRRPQPKPIRAMNGIVYPGSAPAAPGKSSPRPPMLQEKAHAQPGPQTLVQPDLSRRLAIKEEIPIPQALIWTPRIKVVKNIVAPQPAPPTFSQAKPSFDAPNREINVSDVDIASSLIPDQKLKILPTTSSPVVTPSTTPVDLPPSTVSQVSSPPTPVALLSLSNLRMEGTATLPPVNESANAEVKGALTTSPASGAAQGTGSGTGGTAGKGAGPSAPNPAKTAPATAPQGVPGGAPAGPAQGAANGATQSDSDSATDITLPKDGQFGAVVVGDSLQDEYPELSGVWNGRLAYTVYLHVGTSRSWILQYSLPETATIAIDSSGDRLDAPWPYSIVRPNLEPGAIDADALLIHGFVDKSGRFQNLSIAFPQNFPQAQFVLASLLRWQFRPATENGQSTRVEVLLIIPEELE